MDNDLVSHSGFPQFTGRLRTRWDDGSEHLLAAEILILAGLTVQVCVVITESIKLVHNFLEKPKHDQLLLLLARLAEQTGDQATKTDETVKKVAAAALDVLKDRDPPKNP